MKAKWMVAVMMVTACFLSSCGGGKKQAQDAEEAVVAMSIDDVMANQTDLVEPVKKLFTVGVVKG